MKTGWMYIVTNHLVLDTKFDPCRTTNDEGIYKNSIKPRLNELDISLRRKLVVLSCGLFMSAVYAYRQINVNRDLSFTVML